nr:hypothetical protein [Tanacetum cinerariifolium]
MSHRADVLEVTLPPRKRLCIALGPRYEVGESSSSIAARPTRGFRADYGFVATLNDEIRRDPKREVGYGITDTWDEMLVDMPGAPTTDETELGWRMTNFVTTVVAQHLEIVELRAADHRRQAQFIEALRLQKTLHTQMAEFQRQQGPAKGPAYPDAPEEAGSRS